MNLRPRCYRQLYKQKIYTVDFITESQKFTESKNTVEERQKANINQEEPPFK